MLGGHVCLRAFGVCGGLRWKSTLVRGYLMVILKEAHGLRLCFAVGRSEGRKVRVCTGREKRTKERRENA